MDNRLSVAGLVLLGAVGFGLWHLTSSVATLKTQVRDLEIAVTDLQLAKGPAAALKGGPEDPGAPPAGLQGRTSKAGKGGKGKAGKGQKGAKGATGQQGQDRGVRMREIVEEFATEQALDADTTAALAQALTDLTDGVKAVRSVPGGDVDDPAAQRVARQALFTTFEETIRDNLDETQADDLITRIQDLRSGGPPR